METIITSAQGALETILKMPAILTFAFALCALGWVLQRLEFFPNKLIPLAYVTLSGGLMWFLLPVTPMGDMSPNLQYPMFADGLRRVCVGVIVGLLAWAAQGYLFKALGKVFPALAPPPEEPTKPTPPSVPLSVLIASLCIGLGATACTAIKNPTYKTLYAVGYTTDAAYRSYLDLVIAGQLKTNGVPVVTKVYRKYTVAYGAAVSVAKLDLSAPAPTNVLSAAAQVITTISIVKGTK